MPNLRHLFITLLVLAGLAGYGLWRLEIDTDLLHSLPSGDRVIQDGLAVFTHHPIHDQIALDLAVEPVDSETLLACGRFVRKELAASGLFAEVGMEEMGDLFPDLALYMARHLPWLFSEQELINQVLPRLNEEWIGKRMHALARDMATMEGIGQARFIGPDPLGLKDLVLARMAPLAPALHPRFVQGFLLSGDGRHLLLTARPRASGTNTAAARRLDRMFDDLQQKLASRFAGHTVRLIPVGAYRAALDNERIIRHDVNQALLLTTLGIVLLLFLTFSRPLTGLVALLPSLAGMALALFVYSLFWRHISIMVLGFGGALLSITVDHGIAYLLFREQGDSNLEGNPAHEVRTVGIMAVLTSVGAFALLSLSGFPIFVELGRFTALGLAFSFLAVHVLLPRILPVRTDPVRRRVPIRYLADLLYRAGRPGAVAALVFCCGMLVLARPGFKVSMESMNTVSRATREADSRFTEVWGNGRDQVQLMQQAGSPAALQELNDRLTAMLQEEKTRGVVARFFTPALLFPGTERGQANLAAWRSFWSGKRVRQLEESLARAGRQYGFSGQAFAPFLAAVQGRISGEPPRLEARFMPLVNIRQAADGSFLCFVPVHPGPSYGGEEFFARLHPLARIFDGALFSDHLARLLFTTFSRMLAVLTLALTLLLLLFYLDIPLTLITLAPVVFAYVCTLGSLRLLHHPLDIPGLMLSIVVLGMGIDYGIFTVRAHQRYRSPAHPLYGQVRCSVLLAGISTLIGFGALTTARHTLLRSIGLTSFFGIGYSLLGAFLLLPPLLAWYFDPVRLRKRRERQAGRENPARGILRRYETLEAYPRMFVRFKLRLDPLFAELPRYLRLHPGPVTTILDIGCGFGAPACWCLEKFPRAGVVGMDPDPERVRVAGLALGEAGRVVRMAAPDLPRLEQQADLVLLLDMVHYLDERALHRLLAGLRERLAGDGIVVIRFVVPVRRPGFWWRVEDMRVRLRGIRPCYRSPAAMERSVLRAGLAVRKAETAPSNTELAWLVAGRTR
jgi:predicted exporter/SAM-dependent methyltransferase